MIGHDVIKCIHATKDRKQQVISVDPSIGGPDAKIQQHNSPCVESQQTEHNQVNDPNSLKEVPRPNDDLQEFNTQLEPVTDSHEITETPNVVVNHREQLECFGSNIVSKENESTDDTQTCIPTRRAKPQPRIAESKKQVFKRINPPSVPATSKSLLKGPSLRKTS